MIDTTATIIPVDMIMSIADKLLASDPCGIVCTDYELMSKTEFGHRIEILEGRLVQIELAIRTVLDTFGEYDDD